MTKEIQLSSGLVCLIDDADWDLLKEHSWFSAEAAKGYIYARARDGKKQVSMHRVIMNAQPGQMIDHKDGNGLNNQRSNLRFCTPAQNQANARAHKGRAGKKGVKKTSAGTWEASCRFGGGFTYLGTFKTAREAALAYDKAARAHHGEFAKCNYPYVIEENQ